MACHGNPGQPPELCGPWVDLIRKTQTNFRRYPEVLIRPHEPHGTPGYANRLPPGNWHSMCRFGQAPYVCRCLGQCLAIGACACGDPPPPFPCCGAVGMALLYAASVTPGRRRYGGREVPDNAYAFLRKRARARERRTDLRMLQCPVSDAEVGNGALLLL